MGLRALPRRCTRPCSTFKGVARRREEKLANMVRDTSARDLLAQAAEECQYEEDCRLPRQGQGRPSWTQWVRP